MSPRQMFSFSYHSGPKGVFNKFAQLGLGQAGVAFLGYVSSRDNHLAKSQDLILKNVQILK